MPRVDAPRKHTHRHARLMMRVATWRRWVKDCNEVAPFVAFVGPYIINIEENRVRAQIYIERVR